MGQMSFVSVKKPSSFKEPQDRHPSFMSSAGTNAVCPETVSSWAGASGAAAPGEARGRGGTPCLRTPDPLCSLPFPPAHLSTLGSALRLREAGVSERSAEDHMGQLSRVTLFRPAQSPPGPDQLGPVTATRRVVGPWEPVPCPLDGRTAPPPCGCEKYLGELAGWRAGVAGLSAALGDQGPGNRGPLMVVL